MVSFAKSSSDSGKVKNRVQEYSEHDLDELFSYSLQANINQKLDVLNAENNNLSSYRKKLMEDKNSE